MSVLSDGDTAGAVDLDLCILRDLVIGVGADVSVAGAELVGSPVRSAIGFRNLPFDICWSVVAAPLVGSGGLASGIGSAFTGGKLLQRTSGLCEGHREIRRKTLPSDLSLGSCRRPDHPALFTAAMPN